MSPTLEEWYRNNPRAPLRLHLGCGDVRWRDFLNVDLYPQEPGQRDSSRGGCNADVFADMRHLGLPDASVDEIFTSHTLEHFVRWEALDMLADWLRMLKPGGKVVLETADFVRCIAWLFWPGRWKRRLALDQFWGNQWDRLDYETHRYLWSAKELKTALLEIGYARVEISHRTWTHFPGRDMHVCAWK